MNKSPEMKEAALNRLIAETELTLKECGSLSSQEKAKADRLSDAIEQRLAALAEKKKSGEITPQETEEAARLIETQKDLVNASALHGETLDNIKQRRTTDDSFESKPED